MPLMTTFHGLPVQHVHRRPNGTIDLDFYRACAKQERDLAIRQACVTFAAGLLRFFRLTKSTLHNLTPALTIPRNGG
jgi:hypothetical protein